jgi:hypothetical protein
MDEFDRMEGVGRGAESEIEPVSWPSGKMTCGYSMAKSHDLCTVIFLYTLIYDRIWEKYDSLWFPYNK